MKTRRYGEWKKCEWKSKVSIRFWWHVTWPYKETIKIILYYGPRAQEMTKRPWMKRWMKDPCKYCTIRHEYEIINEDNKIQIANKWFKGKKTLMGGQGTVHQKTTTKKIQIMLVDTISLNPAFGLLSQPAVFSSPGFSSPWQDHSDTHKNPNIFIWSSLTPKYTPKDIIY